MKKFLISIVVITILSSLLLANKRTRTYVDTKDAATRSYVATNFVSKSGGNISGDINLTSGNLSLSTTTQYILMYDIDFPTQSYKIRIKSGEIYITK